MREAEGTGRTVEEAIQQALNASGMTRSQVDIKIVDEGAKALFGLLGGRVARVRLTEKAQEPPKPAEPAKAPEAPKPEAPKAAPAPVAEDEMAIRAKAFLDELTLRMDCPTEAEVEVADGQLRVELKGERAGALIGHRGETLDAMQYLTSLVVNRGNADNYARVMLDAENYRQKREEALIQLAERMASKALKLKRKVILEPMNPYERRILHTALQDIPGVETYSEGAEPYRRVVIALSGTRQ